MQNIITQKITNINIANNSPILLYNKTRKNRNLYKTRPYK